VAEARRVLVVSGDSQVGRWLQHRIDTLEGSYAVELDDFAAFDRRLATAGMTGISALVCVLDFAPDAAADAFEQIEHVLGMPDMAPLIVLAQNGDELAAVGALTRGAVDYLPRRLITPELLAGALARAAAARAPRRPAPLPSTSSSPEIITTPPAQPRAAAPSGLPAHDLLPPLRVPRNLIPRYMLLDTLGESARATVYLAHSVALNRHVALKVSRITDDEEPQFAREFETVGGLRDPGIVDIFDYGVHEGREFIAMEYFPCGDLKARLQNPVTEREALDYLERIATALAAVHRQGVLHRDLKPPNIMLREDGQIVLIDFGISRTIDQVARSTRVGVLRGSPYYMSPEQAQGTELDARSDLYSLGIIFYEMLTGAKPYLGATAVEVLQQHVNGALPQLPEGLEHLQPLLDGLLAKNADERFESADALIASLCEEAA